MYWVGRYLMCLNVVKDLGRPRFASRQRAVPGLHPCVMVRAGRWGCRTGYRPRATSLRETEHGGSALRTRCAFWVRINEGDLAAQDGARRLRTTCQVRLEALHSANGGLWSCRGDDWGVVRRGGIGEDGVLRIDRCNGERLCGGEDDSGGDCRGDD